MPRATLLADAPSPSQLLWSPVPPPTALRPGAAETPQVQPGPESEASASAPQPRAASEAGAGEPSTGGSESKRPLSPRGSAAAADKRARYRSPAVASSSGQGESQQSLPSPEVADSPMVEARQARGDSAMWKLTYSLLCCQHRVGLPIRHRHSDGGGLGGRSTTYLT